MDAVSAKAQARGVGDAQIAPSRVPQVAVITAPMIEGNTVCQPGEAHAIAGH